MSAGYVYILTNEAMPGLVKIGKTTRDPQKRAGELYQTGVPEPFDVMEALRSPNCSELEGRVHTALRSCRSNGGREFFKCSVDEATTVLYRELGNQLQDWLQEFVPQGVRFVWEVDEQDD